MVQCLHVQPHPLLCLNMLEKQCKENIEKAVLVLKNAVNEICLLDFLYLKSFWIKGNLVLIMINGE